jgi:two-component system, OmpR family, phosphate regulon response regulator PhoB
VKAARILVVEDEVEIAENLAALLNARGHSCGVCSDSTEALARCRKEQPQLVLLDVMMPRLSGLDLCRLLRADPKTAKLKIVMVTGLGRMGDVEEAFRAGADDYLIKPFDADRLFKKIEKVLAGA